MAYGFCKLESDIDRLLEDDGAFGVAVHQGDDGFPMNLMSNENITWTVERERGISFDLTALYDMEAKPDVFLDIKREIKLEAESGVKESTFGHPFGQCRPTPQPRPTSPSPFSRPAAPSKRSLPRSFDSRVASAKRQWKQQQQQAPKPTPPPALGRTRSHSARPAQPKPSPASSGGSSKASNSTTSGCSISRSKGEASEARVPRRRVGGVDTLALTAELGLVDSRRRCARRNKGSVHRVGAYTLEERAALVAKFHSKRGRRIWRKKIKYDCRKKLADKRPRLKGRFVTQEELDGLDKETLAKVTGLGPYEAESSSSDVEDDSDSSEAYSGPVATTSRYRGGGRCGGGGGRREVQQQRACPAAAVAPAAAAPPSARPGLRSRKQGACAGEDSVRSCQEASYVAPKVHPLPETSVGLGVFDSQKGVSGGGATAAATAADASGSCQVSAMFALGT
ncbi:unnamed protein product, partial [Laminaria digitata]